MKHASLIAATCAALLSGCVKQEYHTDGRVNTDPLVVDQAMQLRDWDKSHANYENGGTQNWSTGFAYAPSGDLGYGVNYVVDLGTFFGNFVTIPITAYNEREGVVSNGVNVPESYTAVPPVPPRARPTGQGVGPTDSSLGNGQPGSNGDTNTVGNPDQTQNSSRNSTISGNRSDSNGSNGGFSNQNGGGNGLGTSGNASGGNTNTGSSGSGANNGSSNGDAAAADVSSGGTAGGGKSRNSGSATGSGAGGSSGAGGAGGGK